MLKKMSALALVVFPLSWGQSVYIDGARTVEKGINVCGADTGTASAYACAMPSGAVIRSYNPGVEYVFVAAHANTGIATLNIDGRGAKTIKKYGGTADLAAGDIALGSIVDVRFDGTNMQLLSPVANAVVGGSGSPTGTAGGDLTGTYPNPTLTSVNPSTGTFGSGSQIPVITVDGKGRITGISTASSGGFTPLSPNPAGSYGSSTTTPVLTINQYGQVTAASTVTSSGGAGGGGTVSALAAGALSGLPSTCTTGGVYFATDQPAGQQLYTCSAANIWTQSLSIGGNGMLAMTNGSLDILPNVVPRLTVTNAFTGLNSFAGGMQLPTTGTRPSCGVSTRGLEWVQQGDGTSTDDILQVCLLSHTSGYTWVNK
jgi:hypothetical protein